MPTFSYRAIGTAGEPLNGVLVAKDRIEVLSMLRAKDYRPIAITEKSERKDVELFASLNRIRVKDIAIFCRQFYTMLNSGISIIQCLDILAQQFDNKKLRVIIGDVYELVQKGASLSDAMRQYRLVFPELLINMVEAGEASGNLDTILGRMADHYEKDTKLRRKITGAMVYPIILSVVTVIVVIVLLTFVMPTFINMFIEGGVELPLPTRILLGVSDFLRNYWYLAIAFVIFLAIFLRRLGRTDSGMMFFDQLKLKMPIFRHVSIKVATARFTRTLSTLLISGIPLLNGMEITSRVVGNRVIEKTIMDVREDVRKGYDLAGPIKRSGKFPPMVDSMIRIGEESGTLDDVLRRTADFYDDEVEMAIQKLTTMLEPLLIVFMAIIVGFIVIAIMLPMFNMYSLIQ
jgi:type IV pilus assembly protein PilC